MTQTIHLYLGDCRVRSAELRAERGDGYLGAVVTDPPYDLTAVSRNGSPRQPGTDVFGRYRLGTVGSEGPKSGGFMGKTWDATGVPFDPDTWREVYKALEPGGILRVFGGTRTFHRLATAIEKAGFVDMHLRIWVQGEGMPKGDNIAKSVDKRLGAKRKKKKVPYPVGGDQMLRMGGQNTRPWIEKARVEGFVEVDGDEAITAAGAEWEGWNTNLKPAWEPIVEARKPLRGHPEG